jgi:hypothetical protein
MDEYVTRSELRSLGADPRTVRKHLEPDAVLINGTRSFELFKRERVKQLAAALGEAIAKFEPKRKQK